MQPSRKNISFSSSSQSFSLRNILIFESINEASELDDNLIPNFLSAQSDMPRAVGRVSRDLHCNGLRDICGEYEFIQYPDQNQAARRDITTHVMTGELPCNRLHVRIEGSIFIFFYFLSFYTIQTGFGGDLIIHNESQCITCISWNIS